MLICSLQHFSPNQQRSSSLAYFGISKAALNLTPSVNFDVNDENRREFKEYQGKDSERINNLSRGVVYGRREGANDSPRFTKRSKIRSFVILINPYQILQLRSAPFCLSSSRLPFPLLGELLQPRPFHWPAPFPSGWALLRRHSEFSHIKYAASSHISLFAHNHNLRQSSLL